MQQVEGPKLNALERVGAYFSSRFEARTKLNRFAAQFPWRVLRNSHRSSERNRLDTHGWANQPWGNQGVRTLTPTKRRSMVKRSRALIEDNMLMASLVDRSVENIIGEGMQPQSQSGSKVWNKKCDALWAEYEPDVRGLDDMGEFQRNLYAADLRDGDAAIILLKDGRVQAIEGDYIQTPRGLKRGEAENVYEGIEVNAVGRPRRFHIATTDLKGNATTAPVDAQDVVYMRRNARLMKQNVRGYPVLAQMGPLLDQIDGTIESVVVAHRVSAAFGLIWKTKTPSAPFGALASDATNMDGDEQKSFNMEPGGVTFVPEGDEVDSVKPNYPTTQFGEFMTFLIRIAGVRLGLPLELALLDYSKTNYSSARASMEQSYRHFRIEQRRNARAWRRIRNWRVSKWIKEGKLKERPDAFKHRWLGQPWPYLDPVKEAQGALIAIDAGLTTLSDELMKRGLTFDEWLSARADEVKAITEKNLPRVYSTMTRHELTQQTAQPQKDEQDDGDDE